MCERERELSKIATHTRTEHTTNRAAHIHSANPSHLLTVLAVAHTRRGPCRKPLSDVVISYQSVVSSGVLARKEGLRLPGTLGETVACVFFFFFRDKSTCCYWCWCNVRYETRMQGCQSGHFPSQRRRSAVPAAIWPWQISTVPQPPSSAGGSPKRPYIRDQHRARMVIRGCIVLHAAYVRFDCARRPQRQLQKLYCMYSSSSGIGWALVLQSVQYIMISAWQFAEAIRNDIQ